jgi:hypothetical protein
MKPNTFKHWNITLKILIESFGIERKLMERKYFIFMEKKKNEKKNIFEENFGFFSYCFMWNNIRSAPVNIFERLQNVFEI